MREPREIAAEIDAALGARSREWPDRGPGWASFVRLSAEFAAALLARSRPTEIPGGAAAGERVGRPLILCGAMKSGTTLLLSLLDGHGDLLALPGDSHMAASFEPPWRDGESAVTHWVRRLINPTAQPPYWSLGRDPVAYQGFVDRFVAALDREPGRPSREFRALVPSLGGALSSRAALWVEKTPENEFHAPAILREFPDARFLYIARDPRSTLAALKRLYALRGWSYSPIAIADQLERSFARDRLFARSLGDDRWASVRYEDLCAAPETVTRRIAAWLRIAWDPILLRPTVFGREAESNSMFRERRVRGRILGSSPEEDRARWGEALDARELRYIARVCGEHNERLGYAG